MTRNLYLCNFNDKINIDNGHRCHVLSSIGTAGEELRLKRKKESDIRDLNASKSVEIISKVNAKKRCPAITLNPHPTITTDVCTTNVAGVRLPIATNLNNSITVPPVYNTVKKRQEMKAVGSGALPHQTKSLTSRCFKHFGKLDSHWLVMIDLPDTVSKSVIKGFLSGLKISEMYGCYHHCIYESEEKLMTDVYVQFESQAGVEAAMLRNGELIKLEKKMVMNKTAEAVLVAKELPVMDYFVTSLNRVSILEATWAKALCIRLESNSNNCTENMIRLRSIFPLSLLSMSPSAAAEKWLQFVPLGSYLLPNEIFSYSDNQKKNTVTTAVCRYDYSESRGLYRDIHQMGGDISYAGISGFGASFNTEQSSSKDPSSSNNSLADSRNHSVRDHPLNDGYIDLRKHHIHGIQELCDPLKEISYNLSELSCILSDTLIKSYSTDIYSINDSISYVENELVLDLAHRMSHMYQNLYKTIKNKRHIYSIPVRL